MTGWHLFRKESHQLHSVVVLAVLALSVYGVPVRAAATASGGVTAGSPTGCEVITLTNIAPERGKELLGRLQLATASPMPGSNALLVTGKPRAVRQATTVLKLVDSRTEYEVQVLGPAGDGQVPVNVQVAATLGGVCVGTFAHPPQDKSKIGAIVDVYQGRLVAVAPTFQMQKIQLAAARGASADTAPDPSAAKPQTTSEPAVAGDANGQQEPTMGTALTSNPPATIPAPAMLGSSFAAQTPHQRPTLTASATGLKAEPKMLAQTSVKSEPVTPAAPQPPSATPVTEPSSPKAEPSAPATPQPTAGKPAEEQPKAPPAEPPVPAKSDTSAAPAAAAPVTPAPAPATPAPTPAAAARTTPAQPAAANLTQAEPIPNGDEVLDLTLQEKMPIMTLLDLVGKKLNLTYVYNPDEVKGEVSLKINGDPHGLIKVKDLYTLLESTLRQANLSTTRRPGNIVLIVPNSRIMDGDPILVDGPSRAQFGDTVETRKFELKYIDTAAAKSLLDGMKVSDNVIAVPEKHLLMVTTYAYRMNRVERLLQMVDQPGEPKKFRHRQLRYTMAKTLAEKVKAMAEQMLESVTVTVAESDNMPVPPRNPGENDAQYRTRVAVIRQQQQMQQAALRAQQQALRGQAGAPEAKAGVYLDADERTNRILMIGAQKQLTVVDELVEALDVQQQDLRTLQLYRIKHVDADDVARKLMEMGIISRLPDNPGSSRYPTQSRITNPLPGQPRTPTTPGTPESQLAPTTEVTEKGLVEEPQVVVVESTNSLLVNATAEQHAKIAHIVEFVDSETLTNEIPYKIYQLENSGPEALAKTLTSLIQETVEQQKEGGKIEKVVVNKDEKIKIVPDPNTYSLIVYANKRNQEWISNLIQQLDKRRPQVLIDVTLVEITNDEKFDYDLNFIRSSSGLSGTGSVPGLATPGGAAAAGVGATTAVATGGGALTAFYGDKQVQALLSTVAQKTYGRVLAKPKLLVNDNEKGKIDAKDTTYVETTSALPVSSGVQGTTSGLVQTATNFQSYDAGVTLSITPHISEGDLLRLDIQIQRSDFGAILGTRPPDKKSSEVDTAVTLPNGATVILGGMSKVSQTKGGAKIPLLSDIPLLGGLFRSIHNSSDAQFLYMFVKAEIIRPDETSAHGMEGLKTLSERNRQAFEKRELEFQTYQDWPGIKSKRIDPPKVLDAQ